MKNFILISFCFFLFLGLSIDSYSQCLPNPGSITSFTVTGITNVTCFGGTNGSIQVTLGGGVAPFTYTLIFADGSGDSQLDQISGTNLNTVTFSGLPANVGGAYKVQVVTSNVGPTTCRSKIIPSIDVTEPAALTATHTEISSCSGPNTGSIDLTVSGGTPGYSYIWSGPTSIPSTTQDPTGLAAGTYSVIIRDANYNAGNPGFCETTVNGIVISGQATITLGANPSVCSGITTANLSYSATTGNPDQYSIDFNAAAEAQGFVDVVNATLPSTPIVITVPSGAAINTYSGSITVRNSVSGCVSNASAITVTISSIPTITLGANPGVCAGTTSASLTYSGTTGTPDRYSIDFNAAAEAQGFVDVTNAVLPSTPISITVPAAAAANTYNATLTVRNNGTGCVSPGQSISVTISPRPNITLGANPTVCSGATTANLTYSAATGSPDLYSIDFNAAAEAQGFVDVVDAPLPASPIVITVPAGANVNVTYSASLTVKNSSTGCPSLVKPITVRITRPSITPGTNPTVCSGATTANLTYTGAVSTPNRYTIDFDAAAEAQGFVDVPFTTVLPASPIVLVVPATAAAATYNATLMVKNNASGCTSLSMPISVTVIAKPTITLGTNPAVCSGATSANLPYTATTGIPDRYSIDFNPAAEAQGFVDVVNAILPVSPIGVVVPAGAAANTYSGTITVKNNAIGCSSTGQTISLTISPKPTITLGANPSVCSGTTTATLPYSATSGTPDQYSIDFDATAEAQGFVDVVNVALPVSPIGIVVPGAALTNTYNGTLTVRNSTNTCISTGQAITVTISKPTITLGTIPGVCSGTTSASLSYTATTGSPDRYSIDFNPTAEAQGFVDVVDALLPASPISIVVPAGATASTYNATITVKNNTNGCVSVNHAIIVTVSPQPTITLGSNPAVCSGITSANLTYTGTTGTPDRYSIDFDATAEGQGFVDVINAVLPASPIGIIVPAAALTGTYNGTLTVMNNSSTCGSTGQAITVTIAKPTITLGAIPGVCSGVTSTNLPYSATTGTPDLYSIDFDAAAESQGFVDVVNAVLPVSPIGIVVPAAALANTYNATVTVKNNTNGCISTAQSIAVTISAKPTITLGANPNVCSGTTTANLNYSAITGSPDRYSIDFDATAEGQGFVDVINAVLPVSPIGIVVPAGAPASTYNATITVKNNTNGCVSANQAIAVTVSPQPTITLGTNPTVCSGITTVNLSYSAVTGVPDQYSIDFDAVAEGQGFVDVVNAALPVSPIGITVPGAALTGTYNGTLTVKNNASTCASTGQSITVTITRPTITLGAIPGVCSGVTSTTLPYSAATGTPDLYSIDFDAAAELQGFVDIVNAALPVSAIGIVVPAAALANTYNASVTVKNNTNGCVSVAQAITVTILPQPTITLGPNPNVCSGAIANLTYSATTGTPDRYSIDFDATAEGQGFVDVTDAVLPASPISIAVPSGAVVNTYNATLTVKNNGSSCVSASQAITITVAKPTITLGANPVVCSGITTANLTYSATSGTPDLYSIDFDATAEGQGFVDVVDAALTVSPMALAVPGAAAVSTYNAILTVKNNTSGCVSTNQAITVTISSKPTITLGVNPSVCIGATIANLTYSASTGAPDLYSIDFDATAEGQGFVDVADAALTTSPIVLTVPGAALASTYNATLTVKNNAGGCISIGQAIAVTISPKPTITLGANPGVCAGTTTANLTYSAVTGTPDLYSIDFDATAEGQGFVDVVDAPLTVSPIAILVPGAATASTYNAILTVKNNASGCVSTNQAITVTISPNPTITLGANPSVCAGATSANLTYSAVTGTPDQYSIDFDATAEGQGFVDVVNAALTATPISITVPSGAAIAIYNATLTVKNSATTCVSTSQPITVTVADQPTLLFSSISDNVCFDALSPSSASISYIGTTGSPDQYSIVFDAAALSAGFVNVTNSTLTASPLNIVVAANTPVATYNATLSVRNSAAGCVSTGQAITIVVVANPTITLTSTSTSTCFSASAGTASYAYTATTGSPVQYSITFDAAAQLAGFVNVSNVALPSSPIGVTIPAGMVAATYNAILTVTNSVTGCVSVGQAITIGITAGPPANNLTPTICETTAGSGTATVDLTLLEASINSNPGITITWFDDLALTSSIASPSAASVTTANNDFFAKVDNGTCQSVASVVYTINTRPTATISGGTNSCVGQPVTLSIALTGASPWDVTYTDGSTVFPPVTGITTSPYTFAVTPLFTTTYSVVSVSNTQCGAGTVSGSPAVVTVNPIPGNPAVAGTDTWIGYVYNDVSAPANPPSFSNIDFGNAKYRGFITDTEIPLLGFSSSYNTGGVADAFDLNLSSTAPLAGPNVCGSYLNDFSIRLRMDKVLPAGVYVFTVAGDDGVRLFIDDIAGIPTSIPLSPTNSFTNHSYTTYTSDPVCLTGVNPHKFILEYFERGGFSRVSFTYQQAPSPASSPTVSACVNDATPALSATITDPLVTGFNWYADNGPGGPSNFLGFVPSTPPGQTFTPSPADLDMSVAGTSDFYVTAVYACGESQAAQVNVDIVTTATINVPPTVTQICLTGGVIDLTTIVTATPAGTLTFTGTGITTSPNFDPAIAGAGLTTINVTYAGSCSASPVSFDINVVPNSTITVPSAPVDICQSSGLQDLNALVSATPAGGAFVFTGTGVTGSSFDPTGLTGNVAINVDYSLGGSCAATTQVINFNVSAFATLAINNSTVLCPTAAPLDLTSLIGANPSGGTFTFSGATGITGNMLDPSFNPNATLSINVAYVKNGCTAMGTVQVIIKAINDPTCVGGGGPCSTPNLSKVDATCNGISNGRIIINSIVGTGPFEYSLDNGVIWADVILSPTFTLPDLLAAGTYTLIIRDKITACTSSLNTVEIKNLTEIKAASITKSDVTTCSGTDGKILFDGLTGGSGSYTFSSNGMAGPFTTGVPNGTASALENLAPGNYIAVIENNGCFSAPVTITIGLPSSCTGNGNVNCNLFVADITAVRPTCSDQNNGVITIGNIVGGTPGPNYVVTLYDSLSTVIYSRQKTLAPGTSFSFDELSPSNTYFYKIDDGSTTCTLQYSLPIKTTVTATASDFKDSKCFNQPAGSAVIKVTAGGNSPYEYSIDGTNWISFVSPVTITNLPPGVTPYNVLVRDDASDLCPAEVSVTIGNAPASDITVPYTITNATCNNNDGSIIIGTITGGTAPYTFRFNGTDFASLPADNTFSALGGGTYTFTVTDANLCSKDFSIDVIFPGLVNFAPPVVSQPTCTGSGYDGAVSVTITSTGSFKAGISKSATVAPSEFQDIVSSGNTTVAFSNLTNGIYFITLQSAGAQCPTITSVTINSGPVPVDFEFNSNNILCFDSKGGVTLTNIKGNATLDYSYEIVSQGDIVQSGAITTLQTLDVVTLTDLDKGTYQIRLTQDQSSVTGCSSPISSPFKSFTLEGPSAALDTLYVNKAISLPDLPTGSLVVGIKESMQEPYEVKLELEEPLFPNQAYFMDYTLAARNTQNLKTELSVKNIYAGIYKLSLRDALGCEKTYEINLNVDTAISIPNIFTPNGDGVNDVFYIRNLPSDAKLIISNRWGNEVYSSKGYSNDWNGGDTANGVYYYRLSASGETFTGWIEIQRGQ